MMCIHTSTGIYEIDWEDCYIRNHMLESRQVYEYHIINAIKTNIEKSNYIVDAGANIGCHAITYTHLNKNAHVWAFEPQKNIFEILQRNVKRNNVSDRITLFNKGLGHTNMSVALAPLESVRDDDPGQGGWNKMGLGIGTGGETIELITIDSLNLPGLDFMKIDVEGAEGLVIQGAAETIKKYKPIIFFEHNHQRIDPATVGLSYVPTPFAELAKLGYRNFLYLDWENYLALRPDN